MMDTPYSSENLYKFTDNIATTNKKYWVFFFLLDRQKPIQRLARGYANVASYAACRGGLTVDDDS